MVDEVVWPIEPIPDADNVFMRAHRMYFREGELQPGVFRAQGDGMSVDWDKYSTAEETKKRAGKNPHDNAVVRMCAGRIREIAGLRVEHQPDRVGQNRAHSNVLGLPAHSTPDLVEVRLKLRRISTIVHPLGS